MSAKPPCLSPTFLKQACKGLTAIELAVVLGLVLFYLFMVAACFNYTEDDPGISFRYAANLADGHGLVYNPGERVEGYSNFGFVLLLSLPYKVVLLEFRPGIILVVNC